jgi:hypothetical protein
VPSGTPQTWRGGNAGGFTLTLGGTPRQNLLIGGELGAVVKPAQTNAAGLGWLSFVSQVYPVARRGLFVRAGLGFGAATLEDDRLGLTRNNTVTTTGFSVQAGLGYDVRFGRPLRARADGPIRDDPRARRRDRRERPSAEGPEEPRALLVGLGFHWY